MMGREKRKERWKREREGENTTERESVRKKEKSEPSNGKREKACKLRKVEGVNVSKEHVDMLTDTHKQLKKPES